MSYDIQESGREYTRRGFGICKLEPAEKRPSYRKWNLSSFDPDRLTNQMNIGIQGGRLSGDLVCIDIDSVEALDQADHFLPPTRMIEGREGKPRSHRYYRVINIPPELQSQCNAGAVLGGGPRNIPFNGPDGHRLIDWIGTGNQAAAPPSLWVSKDGKRQERRFWDEFGDPAIIDCQELLDLVCRLVATFGWVDKKPQLRRRAKGVAPRAELPQSNYLMPGSIAARQARAYVRKMPPAVIGQMGNRRTCSVAYILMIDFNLTIAEALPIFMEYNHRCPPMWKEEELVAKLELANENEGERPRGGKIRLRKPYRVTVNIGPGDQVIVGVDAASVEGSYVDLSPSLFAGFLRLGKNRELVPELATIEWKDKRVILAPPSTIATSKQEVWAVYFLGTLLLEHGAMEVQCLRLPDLGGRKRTLANAKDVDWELADIPRTAREAHDQAEAASLEGERLAHWRKSLPRNKPSPKLERAMAFLKANRVKKLTKAVILKAKLLGINRDALRRGQRKAVCNTIPSDSCLPKARPF
jgi:Bifunctional DNA primase/polymerase, N-terminal